MSGLRMPNAEEVGAIARAAGALTLTYFRKTLQVSEKADNQGLVTEADIASENLIKSLITERFPGHSVLGEESGLATFGAGTGVSEEPLWVVDPIDGTTNFARGNPYFCVSIGFGLRTTDGFRMQAGAIFHPTSGDLYTAQRSKGSACNGEPIRVSGQTNPAHASLVTGFSSNKGTALRSVMAAIEDFQERVLGVRINGAAALDLALTARGVFQGFYERPLSPWDTAAGSLIVEEAGGRVVNFAGASFDPLRDAGIVACAPALESFIWPIVRKHFG